jgi:CRISPR/Cas system CMR-associated protein Cmr3 (group 5 of RAMP superfamily)
MKTKVNSNSIQAYRELDKEISQKEKIFELIRKLGPINSRSISHISGIEISSVVARVNALKKEKRIEVAFTDKCIVTKKKTDFYQVFVPKVYSPGTQAELW